MTDAPASPERELEPELLAFIEALARADAARDFAEVTAHAVRDEADPKPPLP